MPLSFLSEKQVPEFILGLEGRKEIPVKFEYLNDGALFWSRMVKAGYAPWQAEAAMIREQAPKILAKLHGHKANLVYAGCGTGYKCLPLLKGLSKTHSPVNLVLLDFSARMLEIAKRNAQRALPKDMKLRAEVADFEGGNFAHVTNGLRKAGYGQNLVLLLGNTLGQQSNRAQVLGNFRESMTSDDLLLLGVEILPPDRALKLRPIYQSKVLLNLLSNVISRLGVGKEHGHFSVVRNPHKSQIEWRYLFDKDVAVPLGGEWVQFRKGQRLLLGISHKFRPAELRKLLKYAGFKIKMWSQDKDKTSALVLVQPKEL